MAPKSKFDHLFTVDDVTLAEFAQPTTATDRPAPLERLATVAFWIVVAGLVGTRVAYFDPLYGQAMSFAASIARTLVSAFS